MKRTGIRLLFVVFVMAMILPVIPYTVEAKGSTSKSSSGSSNAKGLTGVPDFVNQAYLNASENVLVGVGVYKIGNDLSRMSIAKTAAETRARADITRQLQAIMKNMVEDHFAATELDPGVATAYSEDTTRSLASATLRGARTITMQTENGLLWVVMEYDSNNAAKDFELAQTEANKKLAGPRANAFNALERMDEAFRKEAGGGPNPTVGE